jgi:hypothetical protein
MKDKEKNIATSTSSVYEEYIDTQPNRPDDDVALQAPIKRSGFTGSLTVPLVVVAVVITLWMILR